MLFIDVALFGAVGIAIGEPLHRLAGVHRRVPAHVGHEHQQRVDPVRIAGPGVADDHVHHAVREVILAAVTGEGIAMTLGSPLAPEPPAKAAPAKADVDELDDARAQAVDAVTASLRRSSVGMW